MSAMIFLVFIAGFGLIISNYSDTMLQAVFMMLFFVLIFMLMSGIRGYDFRFRDAVGFRGGDKYSRCRDVQEAELRMPAGLRIFLFERMKRYY